jgi:hypothetical protein
MKIEIVNNDRETEHCAGDSSIKSLELTSWKLNFDSDLLHRHHHRLVLVHADDEEKELMNPSSS